MDHMEYETGIADRLGTLFQVPRRYFYTLFQAEGRVI